MLNRILKLTIVVVFRIFLVTIFMTTAFLA